MDFKEFVNKLEQDLKDFVSDTSPGAQVRQTPVEKLQAGSYTGISITPADTNVGMNINADQLYAQILDEHMEEAQRIAGEESGGDCPAVVMAINPSGYIDVFTAQEFQHMTEEDDAFCEQDIIFDDLLLIHCNPEDVVDLGGIRYLLGTAVIVEMDENGNECSVTHETIENINNRFVCYDIKELGKQLKKIGMLVVQDQVWGRVTANRSAGKATRYYMDEFHRTRRSAC